MMTSEQPRAQTQNDGGRVRRMSRRSAVWTRRSEEPKTQVRRDEEGDDGPAPGVRDVSRGAVEGRHDARLRLERDAARDPGRDPRRRRAGTPSREDAVSFGRRRGGAVAGRGAAAAAARIARVVDVSATFGSRAGEAFKTPEVIKMFARREPGALRAKIASLREDRKLGRCGEAEYRGRVEMAALRPGCATFLRRTAPAVQRRKNRPKPSSSRVRPSDRRYVDVSVECTLALQKMGEPLSAAEQKFLDAHHHNRGAFVAHAAGTQVSRDKLKI